MIKKLTWLWISVLLVCVVVIFFICWWWFRSAQNVSEFQPPERNSTILQNSSSPTHLVTTVLLVRHAEKAIPTGDSPLSKEGETRAQALAHVAGDAGVTAIYATQFLRTQQTVEPLATHLGLSVNQVDADDIEELVDQILSDNGSEVVLVAGHSDTVPKIIEKLSGDSISPIPADEFDNLFIVTIYEPNAAKVVHLNYGAPD